MAVAAFILIAHRRLPVWFLRAAPGIGTILVAFSIYYAGLEAAASYAKGRVLDAFSYQGGFALACRGLFRLARSRSTGRPVEGDGTVILSGSAMQASNRRAIDAAAPAGEARRRSAARPRRR